MSKTVLVADESVTIRSVAESLLRGEAYSVRSAADGNMAVELAKTERPDLVLVGEQLPGMSGADVCAALKADPALRAVPVIFMRTDRPGSAPSMADEVLTKPFSPQSLLDVVHRFLEPGESTSALPFTPVPEIAMADELIDEALGIDDVGPAPAEEMEVNRGGELADFSPEQAENPAGPDDVPAFGTLEEDATTETRTTDSDSLEFSTQVGLEDLPSASAAQARESDLDRALDMALGGPLPAASGGVSSAPPPIEEPPSSLEEISLGDPELVPKARPTVPEAPTPSHASPASPLSLDGEPEPERPHDYDWFIKEMESESKSAAEKKSTRMQDRPRIEPVVPDPPPSASAGIARTPAVSDPPAQGKKSTTGIEIKTEEFQASGRGYDEFISEFRKEIAKLEGALPQDEKPENADITRHSSSGRVTLPDSQPQVSPAVPPSAEIRQMGDRIIDSVTQQVARELAAKIDSSAIYALIEQKLKEQEKRGA